MTFAQLAGASDPRYVKLFTCYNGVVRLEHRIVNGQKVVVLRRRRQLTDMQPLPQLEPIGTGGQLPVFQRRLRRRREAMNLTQEQMAYRTGLSVSGYRRVETGKKMNTRLATLERIAWVLNCEIKDLL